MKKLFAVLLAVATLAIPRAKAQDNMVFNHLSLGVSWGLIDGIGLDVSMPIGPMLDIRAGYYTLDPFLSAISVDMDGTTTKLSNFNTSIPVNYKGNGMDIANLNLTGAAKYSHAELLLDFFPSKTGTFHLTAGAMFSFSPLVHLEGTAKSSSGGNGIPASDWANTTIFGISTDPSGNIIADAQFGLNTVKPYVGLGFGRPVSTERRVGFNFDMGLQITGGLHVYSYDYSSGTAQRVELNEEWINKYEETRNEMGRFAEYLTLANSIPVWPVMRFSLFIRLF